MADQIQADELTLQERLDVQKEALQLQLQNVYKKRKKISVDDAGAGVVPELTMEDFVFVKDQDSHLYPWLLSEAVKLIGYTDDQARDFAERESKHEYEHRNVMSAERKHVFGVRFFEIVDKDDNYYSDGILPEFLYFGDIPDEEANIILNAPAELSPSDKRKIKDIDAKLS